MVLGYGSGAYCGEGTCGFARGQEPREEGYFVGQALGSAAVMMPLWQRGMNVHQFTPQSCILTSLGLLGRRWSVMVSMEAGL